MPTTNSELYRVLQFGGELIHALLWCIDLLNSLNDPNDGANEFGGGGGSSASSGKSQQQQQQQQSKMAVGSIGDEVVCQVLQVLHRLCEGMPQVSNTVSQVKVEATIAISSNRSSSPAIVPTGTLTPGMVIWQVVYHAIEPMLDMCLVTSKIQTLTGIDETKYKKLEPTLIHSS